MSFFATIAAASKKFPTGSVTPPVSEYEVNITSPTEGQVFVEGEVVHITTNVVDNSVPEPTYIPKPFPSNPATLKVLAIGNSYTQDMFMFASQIAINTGISGVTLRYLYSPGSSLEYHWNQFQSAGTYNYKAGEHNVSTESIQSALTLENWDIIVFQQASADSGVYETYQPYLNNLIAEIRNLKPNALIGFHMTWAYSNSYNNAAFAPYNYDQVTMYNAIIDSIQQMRTESEIDFIIPSGTTIQNLRGTSVNNSYLELTDDGTHLDEGAGRYAAACAFFEAVLNPIYGKSITEDNTFTTTAGNIDVTNENRAIIQEAAKQAVIKPYEVSIIE